MSSGPPKENSRWPHLLEVSFVMFFRWKNYLFSCFLSLFCTWIILETKGETAKCNNLLLGQYPFDDDVKSFLFQIRMFSIMSVVFKEHDIFS